MSWWWLHQPHCSHWELECVCDRWERRRGGMGVVGKEGRRWRIEYMVGWKGGVNWQRRIKKKYSPELNGAE